MQTPRNARSFVHIATIFSVIGASAIAVQGAPITEPLIGMVTAGPFAGTVGQGTFTYDPTALVICPVPTEGFFATPETGSFAVSFTIFGQAFTEAADIDYPLRPYFQVTTAGVPITLDFAISEAGNQGLLGAAGNPRAIQEPGVAMIFMSNLTPAADGGFIAEVSVKVIPEPSSYFLLGIGLLGLMGYGWRKRE